MRVLEVAVILDGFSDLADFASWCSGHGIEVYERKRDGRIILEVKAIQPAGQCVPLQSNGLHSGGY